MFENCFPNGLEFLKLLFVNSSASSHGVKTDCHQCLGTKTLGYQTRFIHWIGPRPESSDFLQILAQAV